MRIYHSLMSVHKQWEFIIHLCLWVCVIARAWVSWILVIIVGINPTPLGFGKPIIVVKLDVTSTIDTSSKSVHTHRWMIRILTYMCLTCIIPIPHTHLSRIYPNESIWLYSYDQTSRICTELTSSFPSLSATSNRGRSFEIDLTLHSFLCRPSQTAIILRELINLITLILLIYKKSFKKIIRPVVNLAQTKKIIP